MTKPSCRDCKHLETDGMFGIFCGVGGDNTKYDCPKYEQKREDRMTAKRFKLIPYDDITYGLFDCVKKEYVVEHLPIRFEGICDILNELAEENIRVKREFDSCSHNWDLMYDEAKEKVEALTKENWELEQENEKLENRLWNCQNFR